MIKAFCLAVMCLLYLAAVLALKPSLSSRGVQDAALHTVTSVATISDSGRASPVANASSDRLPVAHSVDTVEKVSVETEAPAARIFPSRMGRI